MEIRRGTQLNQRYKTVPVPILRTRLAAGLARVGLVLGSLYLYAKLKKSCLYYFKNLDLKGVAY